MVRCEACFEENLETINGMKSYLQRINDGDDEGVAYFPGATDQQTSEDNKRLKLCLRRSSAGHPGVGIASEA
jgi:hypothetical protein